jgi:glycosyltransferase involved in cell wall biosynthesis
MRLAIIISHPIRYVVPLFKILTTRNNIQLKVYFTIGPDLVKAKNYNPEYRKIAEWGVPLFEGYEYEFIENVAKNKSTSRYNGINNPKLIDIIKQWNPEAILVFGWNFSSHLKVLRYFENKIPVYFRGDSTLLDEDSLPIVKKIFRWIALTWIYKHVDKALFVGANNKRYYQKFGLKEHQLVYAPHAVDNDRFADFPDADLKARLLRKQLGIIEDEIVFLFAGKFQSKKNPNLLLNAFLKARLKNTHLLFVGEGKMEAELKQQASPYTNIHFMPFQSQTIMPVIYRIGDMFILPSQGPGETWGLVINEAMACGLPVAATDKCGSAIDLIEEGKNGYLFRSNDVEGLSKILTGFVADIEKSKEMGRNSKERIKKFSYEILAPAIELSLLKE